MGKSGRYNFQQMGKERISVILDAPLMITTDQISNFIFEFNPIKHIAQAADDKLLIKLFQTSFD